MTILQKFGPEFGRRKFLSETLAGALSVGVLGSSWRAFAASGDSSPAYPDELLHIEARTKGRLQPGDVITRDNVHLVSDLLDPVRIHQIRDMGRQLTLAQTTTELHRLSPLAYLEASLRNAGKARFDAKGNVVTQDGKPWIGGNPFPDPKSATEVFAAHTLSWGRHESCMYAVKEYDIDPLGQVQFQYASGWAELSSVERQTNSLNQAVTASLKDKLRLQSVFFVSPTDVRGVAYLNIWPYDQTQFPELYGYLPAFKRVRRFPTNQRFEPLIPGSELYLSDAWAAGDPFLTWGDYKIVQRGPYLGAVSKGWNSAHPNWEHKTHGGPKGNTFWDTTVELVPEAIVIEANPVGFRRAPVSKKLVWFDARTLLPLAMVSYDRRGQMFRYFDGSFSLYQDGAARISDGGQPYWSWSAIHAFNVQTGRMTRIEQVREVPGGHRMRVNDPDIYDRYLTVEALQRLGG